MTSTHHDVCIIGMGYVGLTLATAFAAQGLGVIGVEKDASILEHLERGETTFYEAGLMETLAEVVASGRLRAQSAAEDLPAADAYVITVGTPVHDRHKDTSDITVALHAVAKSMPAGALVILRSTVVIGTTEGLAREILDSAGRPYLLAMVPERTVEGEALQELFRLPQIVGGIDEASTLAASKLFSRLGVEIVEVNNPAEAELAKLITNTWRDLQFAFANEIAYVADHAGIDATRALQAAGHNYPRLSLAIQGPVAGPCLGKDGYILAESATHLSTATPLALATREVNERIVEHGINAGAAHVSGEPAQVAIIGLAFKGRPATSDLRGSLAGDFARAAAAKWPGARIVGYDPVVPSNEAATLPLEPVYLAEAAASDVLILHTNHQYFSSADFAEKLRTHLPRGAVVLDMWDQCDRLTAVRPDVVIKPLGRPARGGDS